MKFIHYWKSLLYAFKNRPWPIIVITGFKIFMAVVCLLISFYFYYLEDIFAKTIFKDNKIQLIAIEAIFLMLGIFLIIMAQALWNFQNWARITIYWLNILMLPSSIMYTISFILFFNGDKQYQTIYIICSMIYVCLNIISIIQLKKAHIKSYFSALSKNLYIKNQCTDNFVDLSKNI